MKTIDPFLGDVVALKVVKHNNKSREKNAVDLSHENIIRVINIINNENDDYSMVLMEYFPNSVQLQSILDNYDINMIDKIIKFSIDICKGLEYCHMKKILHLDIKPQNIIVCNSMCKICDFGNSIREEDSKKGYKYNVSAKT